MPSTPMTARQAAYYREVRSLTQTLWASLNELVLRQREWNALDYGTNLPNANDADGDLNGITKAQVGAVVFDSANAIVTVLNTGVATNLAKLL